MVLPLSADLELERTPRLAWRWRLESALDYAAERRRQGDDFTAHLLVPFPFEAERSSIWGRMENRAGQQLTGQPVPGRAINFVWASHEPAGAEWPNPYREQV